jgi:general L-amino acid transport system substrate-binding protein
VRVPHIPFLRCGFAAVILALSSLPARAATLDHIRQTKTLRCGINQETPEYSTSDDHGARQAFDVDICRAVAVAILGSNARTTLVPYPDDVTSMAALGSGKVDLLPTLTLDLKHFANTRITFSPPLLYDGVGFLVPVGANLTHAAELSNQKVCFLAGTAVEGALRAWFAQQDLKLLPFPFNEEGEMQAAFVSGNCAALAGDLTRLAATRVGFGPLAARYMLLPNLISKDPLAAASRADDPTFAAIVRWTVEVLLQAEESGLTQRNVAAARTNDDPTIAVLTGQTREIGDNFGLDNAWATRVIAAVGNYGEIYDRDLGDQSPLKLPRALNRLYTQGGLMYPLPLK